jgi:thiamine biosynthesis protein ThiC
MRHSRERLHRRFGQLPGQRGLDPEKLCEWIAAGSAVIMQRGKRYTGIGKSLSTKVNVNLGTSSTKVCLDDEIQKARIAGKFGADTISDLSMGGVLMQYERRFFPTPHSHTLPFPYTRQWQSMV